MKNADKALGLLLTMLPLVLGVAGCDPQAPVSAHPRIVLVQIGEQAITREAFDGALASAQSAYNRSTLQDPLILGQLKIGVLNQLIEELIIADVADANGIDISEAELAEAAADIEKDYPEGVFAELLLEQAVSYSAWKAGLRSRLLAEKVIGKVLGDKIFVDADDVAAFYRSQPQLNPARDHEKTLALLKREKTEQAYGIWINSLKKDTPMELNRNEWSRIFGGPAPTADVAVGAPAATGGGAPGGTHTQ